MGAEARAARAARAVQNMKARIAMVKHILGATPRAIKVGTVTLTEKVNRRSALGIQGIQLGHMRQAGARNLSFAVTQCNATFLARTCVLKHFHHEILMALLLTFVMVICRRSQVSAS